MKLREICYVAIAAALLSALAPVSIPIGIVPITLATLVIYIIGCIYTPWTAAFAVLLYIVLGAMGLPVFSDYTGGIAKLLGPTGGFIIGYLPAVFVQSLIVSYFKDRKVMYIVSIIVSTIIIYGFGLAWFLISTNGKYDFGQAMMACVYPFIPGDLVKLVLSVSLAYKLRPLLERFQNTEKFRKSRSY